jgi:hypothetical protein
VWEIVFPAPVPPSSKVQSYVRIEPFGPDEEEASKFTVNGEVPEIGLALKTATRGRTAIRTLRGEDQKPH